jgi:hypothetical protein
LAAPIPDPKAVVKNRFTQSLNRDLDLLFMIDDSSSMVPLQAKMRAKIPDFMTVLKNLPGGLPNLHVAVVSSSLGAGIYGDVPGCMPNTQGNANGSFQHAAKCTQLNAGESFLKSISDGNGGRVENFTGGDISPVFSCIADLGQNGCGFEHQFASIQQALERSLQPPDKMDPNYGFLRQGAYLGIVMLTNEDDCSVPANSDLFNPAMQTLADKYGGLQSYRCNEFGHVCDQALPHTVAGLPMTLTGCKSKEDGVLVKRKDFSDFIKSLKPPNSDQILVAALTGAPTPYTVQSYTFMLGNGMTEAQPQMAHSCVTPGSGEYADPAVRIKEWLDDFAPNSVLESICDQDFAKAMTNIANVIGRKLGNQCVAGTFATKADGSPDCDVTQKAKDAAGQSVETVVVHCDGQRSALPCWEFQANAQCAAGSQLLAVCYDSMCNPANKPMNSTDALVACALQ